MSDAASERRKKILANSEKRLQRLQRLKNCDEAKEHTARLLNDTDLINEKIVSNDPQHGPLQEVKAPENKVKDRTEKLTKTTPTESSNDQLNEICNDDMGQDQQVAAVQEPDHTQHWVYKKQRFLVFVFLTVISYLIMEKGFHVYLAPFVGKAWQGKDTFFKLYAIVELQMVLVAVFKGSEPQLPSMLKLAVNLIGVPQQIVITLSKLIMIINMVIGDLSVCLFVNALLYFAF